MCCFILLYFITKLGVPKSAEQNIFIHKKNINSRYRLYVTSTERKRRVLINRTHYPEHRSITGVI